MTWTGRYNTNKKTSGKISKGLKKYYKSHNSWNKGRITSRIIKKFGSHKNWIKYLRKTKKGYYLNDLKQNAMRHIKKRYNYTPERMKQIYALDIAKKERCGYFKRKVWLKWELEYLENNYKKLFIEQMAKRLKRSFGSVMHKLCRMRLLYNNKWN